MLRINLNTKDFEARKSYYSKADLIKDYKNGSKDYKVVCSCDRCSGRGYVSFSNVDNAKCWKCNTTGKMLAIVHVSDNIKAEPTKEELEARIKAYDQKILDDNLALGYKLVDFKLASWLPNIWFNDDSYYRIVKETEKALLLARLDNIRQPSKSYSIEFWVPKSGIIFNN